MTALENYKNCLRHTANWMLRSIENGKGGSCAHFSPLLGWSKPYPETTGYMIPTLIEVGKFFQDDRYIDASKQVGAWLLNIQSEGGAWHGGLHPNPKGSDSVFNTGQILKGLVALYKHTGEAEFAEAANKGAEWLASRVSENGLWPAGDYQAKHTPSYYTHVAWPMLEVWKISNNPVIRAAAERYLDAVLARRKSNGVISSWGFKENAPAFTHTIAYTIRGMQESSRLIGDYERYAEPMEQVLEIFVKKAELSNGRLAGEFDEQLKPTGSYVCLTGNAQLAICFMLIDKQSPDLRLINSAAKLIDFIGSVQRKHTLISGANGAVAGSYPLWGKYMFLRYPNWAAKYYCDALLGLINRIEQEK